MIRSILKPIGRVIAPMMSLCALHQTKAYLDEKVDQGITTIRELKKSPPQGCGRAIGVHWTQEAHACSIIEKKPNPGIFFEEEEGRRYYGYLAALGSVGSAVISVAKGDYRHAKQSLSPCPVVIFEREGTTLRLQDDSTLKKLELYSPDSGFTYKVAHETDLFDIGTNGVGNYLTSSGVKKVICHSKFESK